MQAFAGALDGRTEVQGNAVFLCHDERKEIGGKWKWGEIVVFRKIMCDTWRKGGTEATYETKPSEVGRQMTYHNFDHNFDPITCFLGVEIWSWKHLYRQQNLQMVKIVGYNRESIRNTLYQDLTKYLLAIDQFIQLLGGFGLHHVSLST